jgi:hypothetical protein
MLLERVGDDSLVKSSKAQIKKGDIVDWPNTERDGYVFTETNTVVNAFFLKGLADMVDLAMALGKDDDAKNFFDQASSSNEVFQEKLFDEKKGLYRDGTGTDHHSFHANFFPLAFGLVPEAKRQGVVDFLRGRGMDCSVYASQYLLEALFNNGAGDKAMALITADGDRSWKHMLNTGTTITYEAWDQKYKPNQDWNHAWGAAPANLFPRYILGVRTLEPGWAKALVSPNPGELSYAKGKVPTTRGPVFIDWKIENETFNLAIKLPDGLPAKVDLPADGYKGEVLVDGKKAKATKQGDRLVLENEVSGTVKIELK